MYRPEFNTNRLNIIIKLNNIITSTEAKSELTNDEFKAIVTARNFIKAYFALAEQESNNNDE